MNKTFNKLSSLCSLISCGRATLGFMLVGAFAIFGQGAHSAGLAENKVTASVIDSKLVFDQALNDYFAGRYSDAQKGYNRLKDTDYHGVSAVPAAINAIAQTQYSDAQKSFAEIKKGSSQRDKEYAQLWNLWLTAKQWKGSNEELNKELKRQVESQTWHLPFEKSIAGLYAGRETVESVFDAVSALTADAALHQDALTEATFFAGGYLQNVKHDNAAAKQLFNDNLNKLNSVSLERPLIDRECAALNKLIHQSK